MIENLSHESGEWEVIIYRSKWRLVGFIVFAILTIMFGAGVINTMDGVNLLIRIPLSVLAVFVVIGIIISAWSHSGSVVKEVKKQPPNRRFGE